MRFNGITQQGINRGDGFSYIAEAKKWADGETPSFLNGNFFRPVSYVIQGSAIKYLGYNDVSIKVVHSSIDMLNIVLLFLIATMFANSMWCGIASSLLYAFLPRVVFLSRIEMVHVESTFFVLLTLLFFILSERSHHKSRQLCIFYLMLSGFCAGLATNTHIELAFLGPGYVIYLFSRKLFNKYYSASINDHIISSVVFTVSFFMPYLLFCIMLGFDTVWTVFYNEVSISENILTKRYGYTPKIILFATVFINSFKFYFLKQYILAMVLSINTILIVFFGFIKKKNEDGLLYLPVILILSYVGLYTIFINAFPPHYGRVFMPMLAMIIVTICIWHYKLCGYLIPKYGQFVFGALILLVFIIIPKDLTDQRSYRSPYRYAYDVLKHHVNMENKLLVAPVAAYSFDLGYRSDLYFGENAFYLGHLPIDEKFNYSDRKYSYKYLEKLLNAHKIKFIVITQRIDSRLLNSAFNIPRKPEQFNNLKNWVQNQNFDYSIQEDLKMVQKYINSNGGILLDADNKCKIYQITNDPAIIQTIEHTSFEHWKAGLPLGEWKLISGTVLRSEESNNGSGSLCLNPNHEKPSIGTRIVKIYQENRYSHSSKAKVKLRAKIGSESKLRIFITAGLPGKRRTIEPGKISYRGKGIWEELVQEFPLIDVEGSLVFNIWLDGNSKEPALIDQLSIFLE